MLIFFPPVCWTLNCKFLARREMEMLMLPSMYKCLNVHFLCCAYVMLIRRDSVSLYSPPPRSLQAHPLHLRASPGCHFLSSWQESRTERSHQSRNWKEEGGCTAARIGGKDVWYKRERAVCCCFKKQVACILLFCSGSCGLRLHGSQS